jgi:hypothetical protein
MQEHHGLTIDGKQDAGDTIVVIDDHRNPLSIHEVARQEGLELKCKVTQAMRFPRCVAGLGRCGGGNTTPK